MLNVKTVTEVIDLIKNRFGEIRTISENVPLNSSHTRVLAKAVLSTEFIPDFNRSTVDGYAVIASDVFGCSESIPALLTLIGESGMGRHTEIQLKKSQCVYVHTGSEIPLYADAVVMLENAEDYGDGTIAMNKSCAPGTNIIFRGDDVKPGSQVLPIGKKLNVADIGTLAALGVNEVSVCQRPRVAIISTGDELVDVSKKLTVGKIRDVNAPMLWAAVEETGGAPWFYGIIPDDEKALETATKKAIGDCDILIMSGSTSVGVKDAAPTVIANLGEVLVHGVAAKPGKPTIVGEIKGKPVFGLPGNPLAAYFMFHLFIMPLLYALQGIKPEEMRMNASLARAISSNQGREEFIPVTLDDKIAHPISTKSGLITTLADANGFIRIPRDCEGLKQGEIVEVTLF
jgi:molybdopterin molybdotransferase